MVSDNIIIIRSVSLPVFSFISHRTLNSAGFIRWQLRACFLEIKLKHRERGIIRQIFEKIWDY